MESLDLIYWWDVISSRINWLSAIKGFIAILYDLTCDIFVTNIFILFMFHLGHVFLKFETCNCMWVLTYHYWKLYDLCLYPNNMINIYCVVL